MKENIYFLSTHPIQYHVPLYQLLAKEEDLQSRVFYCSDETIKGAIDKQFGVKVKWDIPLISGYQFTFLRNYAFRPSIHSGFWGMFNPGIFVCLRKEEKGVVIINAWNTFSYLLGFLAARIFGHKIAMRCESPFLKEVNRKGLRNKLRYFLLKNILFRYFVDYFLYIGRQNYRFYKHFNIDDKNLIFTPYAVDNHRFRNECLEISKADDGIDKKIELKYFTVLFTGKLYDVKRPFDLLNSYHKLAIPNKRLIIVGDGEMRKGMEEYIAKQGIPEVIITGFVNQTEISKYYVQGDVLVLCSESETWGLSINEAMNFELPIVAYDSVGCAEDLIKQGVNGYVVPRGNIELLSQAIEKIYHENIYDNQMGKESLKIIDAYSNEKIIEGLRKMYA